MLLSAWFVCLWVFEVFYQPVRCGLMARWPVIAWCQLSDWALNCMLRIWLITSLCYVFSRIYLGSWIRYWITALQDPSICFRKNRMHSLKVKAVTIQWISVSRYAWQQLEPFKQLEKKQTEKKPIYITYLLTFGCKSVQASQAIVDWNKRWQSMRL